jgi:hypothetical protein
MADQLGGRSDVLGPDLVESLVGETVDEGDG